MSRKTRSEIEDGIAWITLDDGKVNAISPPSSRVRMRRGPEEAARLRSLDMPSFAATKARINRRALDAIQLAVSEELGTTSPSR